MATYTQFGCGYPTANQLLPASSLGSLSALPNTQSPVPSSTHAPSLSPLSLGRESGGSSSGGGGTNSGMLTPDPTSQTSASGALSNVAVIKGPPEVGPSYTCSTGSLISSVPSPCCDNGRPIITDPVSGQTVCSCQYDPTRLALSSYTRIQSAAAAGVGVYGTPYPSNEHNPYPSIGVESTPFYSSLNNPYAIKDTANGSDPTVTAWTTAGLQPTSSFYTYDPAFSAYGYSANYDLAARRKNATRESTATLKAWLNEHKKNPYPTKGEKIMLAIITKMTLTQVSTWFANARRRLKKENKMTWEPKNRAEDDDDEALPSDDEKERLRCETEHRHNIVVNPVPNGNSNSSMADGGAGGDPTASTGGLCVGRVIGSNNTGTGAASNTAPSATMNAASDARMSTNPSAAGLNVGVSVISGQQKDPYLHPQHPQHPEPSHQPQHYQHPHQHQHQHQHQQAQQSPQYSLNFYYSSNMPPQQHFPPLPYQQHQSLHARHPTQSSVLTALTQHVVDCKQQQQQQQHQHQQPHQHQQ